MNKKNKKIFSIGKLRIIFLQILSMVLQLGGIILIYLQSPINRIAVMASYLIIAPIISWILKKIFSSAKFDTLATISIFISNIVLYLAIALMSPYTTWEVNNDLFKYISTLLFAIFSYYVFGNEYYNKIYGECLLIYR